MVIDADGHANEPNDLFDRYLEKEFKSIGPKVVEIGDVRLLQAFGCRIHFQLDRRTGHRRTASHDLTDSPTVP